jgi:hypothetical protein
LIAIILFMRCGIGPKRTTIQDEKMARLTKAQKAVAAQAQAPWAFPKAEDFEAAAHAGQSAAADAAKAFFASRIIENDAASDDSEADDAMSDDEIAAQQEAAEKAFDKAIESAMKAADEASAARGSKKPYIRQSSIARPTKKVWAIADAMRAHAEENSAPIPSRSEIIAECIRQGIASGTSATQYQAWKKAMGY